MIVCEDFVLSLDQSVAICEQNSDKLTEDKYFQRHSGEDEYWFILLEKLYDLNKKLRLKREKNRDYIEYFDEFSDKISKSIREVMEKMCSYVSIQSILTVIIIIININRMSQRNISQPNLKSLKLYC